jgi:hypothetical protein
MRTPESGSDETLFAAAMGQIFSRCSTLNGVEELAPVTARRLVRHGHGERELFLAAHPTGQRQCREYRH